jgi:hypothetical protein
MDAAFFIFARSVIRDESDKTLVAMLLEIASA